MYEYNLHFIDQVHTYIKCVSIKKKRKYTAQATRSYSLSLSSLHEPFNDIMVPAIKIYEEGLFL